MVNVDANVDAMLMFHWIGTDSSFNVLFQFIFEASSQKTRAPGPKWQLRARNASIHIYEVYQLTISTKSWIDCLGHSTTTTKSIFKIEKPEISDDTMLRKKIEKDESFRLSSM